MSGSESEPDLQLDLDLEITKTIQDAKDREVNKKIIQDGFPLVLRELSTLDKISFLAQVGRLTQTYTNLVKLAEKANKPELVTYLIKHTKITQNLLDKAGKKIQVSIANNNSTDRNSSKND